MRSTPEWWQSRMHELLALTGERPLLYIYNEEIFNDIMFDLLCIEQIDKIFYPVFANPNCHVLKKVLELGACFKCCSWQEIDLLLDLFPGIESRKIMVMAGFMSPDQLKHAVERGFYVTVGLGRSKGNQPGIFDGKEIILDLSFLVGQTNFRSLSNKIAQMDKLLEGLDGEVVGVHLDPETGIEPGDGFADVLAAVACLQDKASHISVLSMGGRLLSPGGKTVDGVYFSAIEENLETVKEIYPDVSIWLHLGPEMISHAGVLIARPAALRQQNRELYAEFQSWSRTLLSVRGEGIPQKLVGLSGEHPLMRETQERRKRVLSKPNSSRGLPVQEEDVWLVTEMGAAGFGGADFGHRNTATEYFLRARKLCPVKI